MLLTLDVTLRTADTIVSEEANPIGLALMSAVGVNGFVAFKCVGTFVACLVMLVIANTRYRHAIIPVLVMQLALFFYLNLAGHDGWPTLDGNGDNWVLVRLWLISYF